MESLMQRAGHWITGSSRWVANSDFGFWILCFGTFFIVLLAAGIFCKNIVTPRGNELREEIKLKEDGAFAAAAPDAQSKQLCEQHVRELVARGNASIFVFHRFTEYNYIAIISALASATLAGIAAFLISSHGWAEANSALRGFFVGSAASLSFWLSAMQVFKYTETIAKHEAIYVACWDLLVELKQTILVPPTSPPFSLPEFLLAFARKVAAIRAIGISFDGSKIGIMKIEMPGK